MGKKLQLQIPLPCHEDWDKMTALEKGKFCSSCQKPVIDFTGMSDAQLMTFFKKPSIGSVCGRFQEDQLNRDMRKPPKRLPWIKYFFQFTLPAFLISMKADAQKERLTGKIAVCSIVTKGEPVIKTIPDTIPIAIIIRGHVTDDKELPLANAAVMIKGTHRGVVTDSNGNFSIKPGISDSSLTLVVSYVGFEVKEKTMNMNEYVPGTIVKMTIELQPAMLGEVVVAGYVLPNRKGRVGKVAKTSPTCNKRNLKDSIIAVFSKFSVYPNPVIPGQTIVLENKKLPGDDYGIDMVNQSGQIVHSEERAISSKQKINIAIPYLPAGVYFLHLTGKKSSTLYSEKIIIE